MEGVGVGVVFVLVGVPLSELIWSSSAALERHWVVGLGSWEEREFVVWVFEVRVEFASSSSLLPSGEGDVTPRASSCSACGVSTWDL